MNLRNNQKGLVSLITVVVLSLLLLVFVVGMTIIVINLQNQATNANLSVKAFYAAETRVEEAALAIKNAVKNNTAIPYATTGCGPTDTYCQTISKGGNGVVETFAKANEANQYEVPQSADLTNIVIEWNSSADSSSPTGYPNAADFPTGANWSYPAAIELVDVNFGTANGALDGNINAAAALVTSLIEPLSSGTGTPTLADGALGGRCEATGTYNCRATISGFASGRNHIIRVRPRYAATHFKITFNNATGPIPVSVDNKATIDVTAKVGEVSRRVTAQVAITQGTLSGLDYAIFGDDRICKDFTVNVIANNNETAEAGACPL